MTDKTNTIREKFEETLVDVLRGRPVVDKDGACVTHEDGTPVLERPQASDLSVVRAYLKDRSEPKQPEDPKVPQTGEPTGVLAAYAARKGVPFGGSTTKQ
jgi:hypothetical protein